MRSSGAMRQLQRPPYLTHLPTSVEICNARANDRLLSLTIRLPSRCNLRCRYCHSGMSARGVQLSTLLETIEQAHALGAQTVTLAGEGEPLLYPDLFPLLDVIEALGLHTVLYTNCTLVTPQLARSLFLRNLAIVGKVNSFTPLVQDFLTSTSGSFHAIQQGIKALVDAGFTHAAPSRLSIHTMVCRQNLREIPLMWRWMRHNNILPQVQLLVPSSPIKQQQYSAFHSQLAVAPHYVTRLFRTLSSIDAIEFGYSWEPLLPLAPYGCCDACLGLTVSARGDLRLCAYVEDSLGNVRDQSLAEFLQRPDVLQHRRADLDHAAPCRVCTPALRSHCSCCQRRSKKERPASRIDDHLPNRVVSIARRRTLQRLPIQIAPTHQTGSC